KLLLARHGLRLLPWIKLLLASLRLRLLLRVELLALLRPLRSSCWKLWPDIGLLCLELQEVLVGPSLQRVERQRGKSFLAAHGQRPYGSGEGVAAGVSRVWYVMNARLAVAWMKVVIQPWPQRARQPQLAGLSITAQRRQGKA